MTGIPISFIGRTEFLSFGITILFGDISDLYSEKIEGDYYYVDG
jgi:hypothetical protein